MHLFEVYLVPNLHLIVAQLDLEMIPSLSGPGRYLLFRHEKEEDEENRRDEGKVNGDGY